MNETVELEARRPDAAPTAEDDNGGVGSFSSLTYFSTSSTQSRTLYIRVEGFSPTVVGDYSLSITDLRAQNTSTAFTNDVDLGDPIDGVILEPVLIGSSGDTDY